MTTDNTPLAAALGILPRTSEETVLRLLLELAKRIVGAEEGSLMIHDPADDSLVIAMTVGRQSLVGQRVPLGKGITGLAAASGEVQIGPPTHHGIDYSEDPSNLGAPKIVIAAPMLKDDDNLIGVMAFVSFDPAKRFTNVDGAAMMNCAAIAAVVIEQHQRLKAYEAVSGTAADSLTARTESDALDLDIVAIVSSLMKTSPAKRREVATLLKTVQALARNG